jgi:hypothetical protein
VFLFQKRFHAGLVDGSITLSFRQWPKARVKPKGRYRVHPIGVIEVDALTTTTLGRISAADAKRAGFADKAELVAYVTQLAPPPVTDDLAMFRIELHHGGDGDRVVGALVPPTPQELEETLNKLARLDGDAPWTRAVLKLIAKHPRIAASKLAARIGRDTEPFKIDVRKLKKLGLTQSFEVGYEVTVRGLAVLAAPSKRLQRRKS